MPNSIEPLKSGGMPSFPLSPQPHYSRVEDEISIDDGINSNPKNYQFVAFRPGFPLQGSELNEIQEHYQLQLTLTIAMMNNWITSGAGPMWRDGVANLPGDGSMNGIAPPNTGLGVGGNPTILHEERFAISGPGWRGSTPLHPFKSPYSGGVTDNQVEVEFIAAPNDLRITFNPGWWCVELPQKNPSDGSTQYISGLKHWIYLNDSFTVSPDISIPVNSPPDIEIPVGLALQSIYYSCCEESDDPTSPCDPELGDNAAGFSNPVGCGASRYAVNAIGAASVPSNLWPGDGQVWSTGAQSVYDQLSLVCKVNPFKKTVRYMNNILLFTW